MNNRGIFNSDNDLPGKKPQNTTAKRNAINQINPYPDQNNLDVPISINIQTKNSPRNRNIIKDPPDTTDQMSNSVVPNKIKPSNSEGKKLKLKKSPEGKKLKITKKRKIENNQENLEEGLNSRRPLKKLKTLKFSHMRQSLYDSFLHDIGLTPNEHSDVLKDIEESPSFIKESMIKDNVKVKVYYNPDACPANIEVAKIHEKACSIGFPRTKLDGLDAFKY